MLENDFCIVSGFFNTFSDSTPDIHCINTHNSTTDWVQSVSLSDDDSIEGTMLGTGVSHGGTAVVGSKFYVCGGVSHRLWDRYMESLTVCLLFDFH